MSRSKIQHDVSCMDDFDPDSLLPDQARDLILQRISPVAETVCLPLRDALNHVLAEPVHSEINVPSGTNSAMDGYAIAGEDLPEATTELTLVGTSLAGSPYKGAVKHGECVRIMTGAILPEGADTVVIQEQVELTENGIRIDNSTKPGANVRQAGEDIAAGTRVLDKGIRLTPADIGLIASLGIAEVNVCRPLKVAFFSTGDELRSIGEPLADGAIYDSNRYTLFGMLKNLNVEIHDLGVVRDTEEDIEKAFTDASAVADVVITSGGVSVGDADYIKPVLNRMGDVYFWKVAMKPGRPLTFGHINESVFFGLPGNPVSVMVTFYQFVQPALKYMMNETRVVPVQYPVICQSRLKKRAGRVEYQRGVVSTNNDGEVCVEKTGAQGSGILTSMSRANCFIILPMESTGVAPGDTVLIQPFEGLV